MTAYWSSGVNCVVVVDGNGGVLLLPRRARRSASASDTGRTTGPDNRPGSALGTRQGPEPNCHRMTVTHPPLLGCPVSIALASARIDALGIGPYVPNRCRCSVPVRPGWLGWPSGETLPNRFACRLPATAPVDQSWPSRLRRIVSLGGDAIDPCTALTRC